MFCFALILFYILITIFHFPHSRATRIADYGVAAGVAANDIKNGSASPASIFINGNMARTVLAAYKIKGNQSHLDAGLAWCDAFVAVQIPLMTSTGEQGGYWDTGYSEIFIADTGTAVAALTLCHSLQPAKAKQAAYEAALRRYTLFVTKGCSTPPTKPAKANATRCPPKGQGWVIPAPFPDAGALGDGYYQGSINLSPYTISTATTGSCAFVEYDDIQKQPELESIAKNAVKWILSKVQASIHGHLHMDILDVGARAILRRCRPTDVLENVDRLIHPIRPAPPPPFSPLPIIISIIITTIIISLSLLLLSVANVFHLC